MSTNFGDGTLAWARPVSEGNQQMKKSLFPALLLGALSTSAAAQDFHVGDPGIRSMSALGFHPDGVLFVGDGKGGAVFALDLDPGEPASREVTLLDVESKLAARLGTTAAEVMIHDLAVHPINGKVFLSVSRGRSGWQDQWQLPNDVADADILVTIEAQGKIEALDLRDIPFARMPLPTPVAEDRQHSWKQGVSLRADTITDMAFVDGLLLVTGLSNEEFSSTLWKIPFPFEGQASSTTLEIYHGAHGTYETHAPIRTFVPYELAGEGQILAAYLCTPFVTFPMEALQDGKHLRGRTVAEMGSGNYPLDMVVCQINGRDRLLIANSNLPFMIVKPEDIAAFEGEITQRPAGYLAGVSYETRSGTGIQQLDVLGKQAIVVLQRMPGGTLDLVTLPMSRF